MQVPKVMVLSLTKNDAKYLPKLFKSIENLNYPHEALRFVWVYGKSVDNTLQLILDFHKAHDFRYEVYEEPVTERKLNNALYLAGILNSTKSLYQGEDYVWVLDSDLEYFPPNTLWELIKVNKDIVAPYIYVKVGEREQFYDTYVFRFNNYRFSKVEHEGNVYTATNPLFADYRTPVKLDSVGTTALIKGKVFAEVDWDDPAPFLQFCKNARKKGYEVYALPYLKVYHSNVAAEESPHWPLESYVLQGLLPKTELLKVGYVYRDGKYVFNEGYKYGKEEGETSGES